MSRLRRRGRAVGRPRRGQSLIEFALVLPIFLLVVFGLFDIGRIVFLKVELENAVREGARMGMVGKSFAEIEDLITAQPGLSGAGIDRSCDDGDKCEYGSRLTVEASLPVEVMVGLVPALPSPNITASASVWIE